MCVCVCVCIICQSVFNLKFLAPAEARFRSKLKESVLGLEPPPPLKPPPSLFPLLPPSFFRLTSLQSIARSPLPVCFCVCVCVCMPLTFVLF